MTRVAAWGIAATVCWLTSLLLVLVPVVENDHSCGGPVEVAFWNAPNGSTCGDLARQRLNWVAASLIVTGGVSTALVAQCALAGRRPE